MLKANLITDRSSPRLSLTTALSLLALRAPGGFAQLPPAPPSPSAVRCRESNSRSRQDGSSRDNLIAWCIVPFDSKKRGPEDRAAMLQKLGFKHFAYDWRGEHIPTVRRRSRGAQTRTALRSTPSGSRPAS